MYLSQIYADLGPLPPTLKDLEITGMSADSREIQPGFLFVALSGETFDGAEFIDAAIEKGAVAVLCEDGADVADDLPVPLIRHDNPRLALALMARRVYPKQPDVLVAVTGTNGKSSVVSFVRQIWDFMGLNAASIGTIGIETKTGVSPLSHTTPDSLTVSAILQELSDKQIDHVAFEASSHGLSQYRLHGLKLVAGGFTNISRDHMDYHPTFENYFAEKMRLFEEVLPPGSLAVISADHERSAEVMARAQKRGLNVFSVGEKGDDIRLVSHEPRELMQHLHLQCGGEDYHVSLPLAGSFQVENALVAAGLVIGCGASPSQVLPVLERLQGAKGRLEKVALSAKGAPIFVDYAHTPDALKNALQALRPITQGRLFVVFGCGGDRDKGKRPFMGEAAEKYADRVIVTDDNPRSEQPDEIRQQILKACAGAENIGDRRKAITRAIEELEEGDVLLVAGKGHETGQIIAGDILPFSDHDVVCDIIESV